MHLQKVTLYSTNSPPFLFAQASGSIQLPVHTSQFSRKSSHYHSSHHQRKNTKPHDYSCRFHKSKHQLPSSSFYTLSAIQRLHFWELVSPTCSTRLIFLELEIVFTLFSFEFLYLAQRTHMHDIFWQGFHNPSCWSTKQQRCRILL